MRAGPQTITHQPQHKNSSESLHFGTVLCIDDLTGHSPVTFLLDSRTIVSVIQLDAIASKFRYNITKDTMPAPTGTNGSSLDVVGQIKMPVSIGSFKTDQVFVVITKLTVDCLII